MVLISPRSSKHTLGHRCPVRFLFCGKSVRHGISLGGAALVGFQILKRPSHGCSAAALRTDNNVDHLGLGWVRCAGAQRVDGLVQALRAAVSTIHSTAQLPLASPYLEASIRILDLSFAVHCSAVCAHIPIIALENVVCRISSPTALRDSTAEMAMSTMLIRFTLAPQNAIGVILSEKALYCSAAKSSALISKRCKGN